MVTALTATLRPLRLLGAIAITVGLVIAPGTSSLAAPDPSSTTSRQAGDISIRKNVADLSPGEKKAFVDAILAAKATPDPLDPSHSYYDRFVLWHKRAFSCSLGWNQQGNWAGAAHNTPTFLPWHRQFLAEFEQMLRDISGDPTMTVPYWDWTSDASTRAVFSEDFMGGDGNPAQGYAVTTGPFAKGKWTLNILDPVSVQRNQYGTQETHIVRHFGTFAGMRIYRPTVGDVSEATAVARYDHSTYDANSPIGYSFRNMLEGWRDALPATCHKGWMVQNQTTGSAHALHNMVHIWVAGVWTDTGGVGRTGTMGFNTSPNDPVFFLHHANIDRIFAAWEKKHLSTYRPLDGAPFGWNATDTMWPWHDRTINSWFGTVRNGYRYEALPS